MTQLVHNYLVMYMESKKASRDYLILLLNLVLTPVLKHLLAKFLPLFVINRNQICSVSMYHVVTSFGRVDFQVR